VRKPGPPEGVVRVNGYFRNPVLGKVDQLGVAIWGEIDAPQVKLDYFVEDALVVTHDD
jgi:hypothetical protein